MLKRRAVFGMTIRLPEDRVILASKVTQPPAPGAKQTNKQTNQKKTQKKTNKKAKKAIQLSPPCIFLFFIFSLGRFPQVSEVFIDV